MRLDILLPVVLFQLAWWLMLATYALRIAEWMTGATHVLLEVYVISTAAFTAAFLVSISLRSGATRWESRGGLQLVRSRSLLTVLGLCAGIVALNAVLYGAPPVSRALGVPALHYSEYGRLKNLLLPAAGVIIVASIFVVGRLARLMLLLFGIGVLLSYMARGPLLVIAGEYLIAKALYTRAKVRETLIAIGGIIALLLSFGPLGEIRSGPGHFKEVMRIRESYGEWPTSILWLIGYVSFPAENLVSLISADGKKELGQNVVLKLLPAFAESLAGSQREGYLTVLPNPANNVPTYLGWAWLDWGWPGIVIMNMAYGVIGGLLAGRKPGNGGLVALPYYGAVATLFFNDHLFWFPNVVQMLLFGWVERELEERVESTGEL